MEDIHQLRVNMKKLRAFFRLLEFSTNRDFLYKDLNKFFRKIFKIAGSIREAQVNIELLKTYKPSEKTFLAFERFVDLDKPVNKEKLGKAIETLNIEEIETINQSFHKFFISRDLTEKKEFSLDFIGVQIDKIKDILANRDDAEKIHRIRIHLKTIKPILYVLTKIPDGKIAESSYLSLKDTEDIIGAWHDQVVLATSLRESISANYDKHYLKEIEILRAKINIKCIDLYSHIMGNLDKTLLLLG